MDFDTKEVGTLEGKVRGSRSPNRQAGKRRPQRVTVRNVGVGQRRRPKKMSETVRSL